MLQRGYIHRLVLLFAVAAGLSGFPSVPPTAGQSIEATWQPWGGPAGRITQLAVDGTGREVYAVAVSVINRRDDETQWANGGSLRFSDALYRSGDAGATWAPLTNDLPPGSISEVYVDPNTGDLLVGLQARGDALTERSGLWRLSKGHTQWHEVDLGRDDFIVRAIVRAADGSLVIGGIEGGKYASSFVYRSVDDGATWSLTEALRFEQRPGSILRKIVAHPTDPDRLFITTLGGDLFLSADQGRTWALGTTSNTQTDLLRGPALLAQIPDRPDSMVLVRSVEDRLAIERSTDAGTTWTQVLASNLPHNVSAEALLALQGSSLLLSTSAGSYRSVDNGATWQLLEGALSSGGVSEFAVSEATGRRATVYAATGYGIFESRDAGAIWQPASFGLPANSRIAGLITHPKRPGSVYAISDNDAHVSGALPPLVLVTADGGKHWTPTAEGIQGGAATAWAGDPNDADSMFVATHSVVYRTTDAGVTWTGSAVAVGPHKAIVVAPTDSRRLYLAGRPPFRSDDGGTTWHPLQAPGTVGGREIEVNGLAVDPQQHDHIFAATSDGIYESRDGGGSWLPNGLSGQPVGWVRSMAGSGRGTAEGKSYTLYAGIQEDGIYRRPDAAAWQRASSGLPAGSTILDMASDERTPGTLWATRDGGGVYRSQDGGDRWANAGSGLGDNVGLALAVDYATSGSILLGTASAGVWSSSNSDVRATPEGADTKTGTAGSSREAGVDARIEVFWPHDFASVGDARLANMGIRLFAAGSLELPACGWRPQVTVWEAADISPAKPLREAEHRTVDGQPFPYWELNDIDVRAANDGTQKLYYFVEVQGVKTATSIWAHGADARTYFPVQDVPSGIATGRIDEVDARIQIVWPHDEDGNERSVEGATLANVAVAFFQHGTRLSVPLQWQAGEFTLYGAWNQEVGRPLSTEAQEQVRKAGAITYPVWEFNNIPVSRARAQGNRLYLWADAEEARTYPTIWAHGADSRTFFPTKDEPIEGCVP